MKKQKHKNYRLTLMDDAETLYKLSVPSSNSAFNAIYIAKKELRAAAYATHVRVRNLKGREVIIKRNQSWLITQARCLELIVKQLSL